MTLRLSLFIFISQYSKSFLNGASKFFKEVCCEYEGLVFQKYLRGKLFLSFVVKQPMKFIRWLSQIKTLSLYS